MQKAASSAFSWPQCVQYFDNASHPGRETYHSSGGNMTPFGPMVFEPISFTEPLTKSLPSGLEVIYRGQETFFVLTEFVLVPGAWLGAWAWKEAVPLLEKEGHSVYPVTLTGMGDRVHLASKDLGMETAIKDVL